MKGSKWRHSPGTDDRRLGDDYVKHDLTIGASPERQLFLYCIDFMRNFLASSWLIHRSPVSVKRFLTLMRNRVYARHMSNIVKEAVAAAGTLEKLGDACGVTKQAVWYWLQSGVIPVAKVLAVEAATGIPREKLRPDIFGAPRPRPRRQGRLSSAAA